MDSKNFMGVSDVTYLKQSPSGAKEMDSTNKRIHLAAFI